MAARDHSLSTLDDVLYQGHRDLRDLGNDQPGFSLEKHACRELGLLDQDGVNTDQCVHLRILSDGRLQADLQI